MDIITYDQAKQSNLKYYFTGKPCPNGHIDKRKVHNRTCYSCSQLARDNRERSAGVTSKRTIRIQVLNKFGSKCGRCGFSDTRALQIDHVNGGGKKEINTMKNYYAYCKKILNDTTGMYQLLCANCNWIKRAENKEHLKPHEVH